MKRSALQRARTREAIQVRRAGPGEEVSREPTADIDTELAEHLGALMWLWRTRVYAVAAARAGIVDTSSARVLAALNRLGEVRVTDLSSHLGLDSSTSSRHVAKTTTKGWVRRSPDKTDGRTARLSLTPAGRAALGRFKRELLALYQTALEGWSDDERKQLLHFIDRLRQGAVQATRLTSPHWGEQDAKDRVAF